MSYYQPYPPQTQVVMSPVRPSSTAHLVIAWVLAVTTALYLLPWAIAATRNKTNVVAIALLNLFLGWTLIGWIATLVMACVGSQRHTVTVIQTPQWQSYPSYPAMPYEPTGQHGPPATYGDYRPPVASGPEPTLVLGPEGSTPQPRPFDATQPILRYPDLR